MCQVLDISTSGYYAWLGRGPSARAQKDEQLKAKIRHFHAESRGTYAERLGFMSIWPKMASTSAASESLV